MMPLAVSALPAFAPRGAARANKASGHFCDDSPTVVLFVALIRSSPGAMISR
jgi:hypothetical protein